MVYSILGVTLLISFITDLRERKIFNSVTFPAILLGLSYHAATGGIAGFLFSGKGFIVGLLLLLIPYLQGGMGAGDVKLMAAIGSLTGSSFVFQSFLYGAIIGGCMVLFLIIKKKERNFFKNFISHFKSVLFHLFYLKTLPESLGSKEEKSKIKIPYGVSIALGAFCTVIAGWFS